uniref:Putative deoxyribonuclease ii n=1 Tax=Rhipicephalus microplus TaxID=6941 RepID=A0A6M2D884_RHIMP
MCIKSIFLRSSHGCHVQRLGRLVAARSTKGKEVYAAIDNTNSLTALSHTENTKSKSNMATCRIEVLVIVVTSIIANSSFGNAKVSCKNAKNKDVDWFVVYKIPKTKPDPRSFKRPMGGEMAYYDSQSTSLLWTLLPDDVNNKTSNPISNTLAPIYDSHSNVAYLAYNDQLPAKFNGTRGGHTKGRSSTTYKVLTLLALGILDYLYSVSIAFVI